MKLNDIPIAWIHIITIITWKGPSLSSTRQFNAKGPLFFCPENPSVSHEKSVSSPQKTVSLTQKNISSTHWRFLCVELKVLCAELTLLCGELTGVENWRIWSGVELICLTEGYSMKTIPTKYYNVRYLQLDSSSQKPFLYSRDRSGFFQNWSISWRTKLLTLV